MENDSPRTRVARNVMYQIHNGLALHPHTSETRPNSSNHLVGNGRRKGIMRLHTGGHLQPHAIGVGAMRAWGKPARSNENLHHGLAILDHILIIHMQRDACPQKAARVLRPARAPGKYLDYCDTSSHA